MDIMPGRTTTKITIQARMLAYMPDQVHVTFHYGRGVPRDHWVTVVRPRYADNPEYGMSDEDWAESIAQVHRARGSAPVVVLPTERTRY